MALDYPRALGPGVREVVGDDELIEITTDGTVSLLRPAVPTDDLLVMHQRPPDTAAVLDEADRLAWLAGRGPAPVVIASGRADEGDEALVISHGVDATSGAAGHPMGPEALIDAVASSLRTLHDLDVEQCPLSASTATMRELVDERIERGLVGEADEGPYAGRPVRELVDLFDDLMAELLMADPDPDGTSVFIHGGLRPDRIWFDPEGAVTFTGWRAGGVGDRHLDLAAAARIATDLYGPALVGPLFDSYGLDEVDVRRLDAHQLLGHLLT